MKSGLECVIIITHIKALSVLERSMNTDVGKKTR